MQLAVRLQDASDRLGDETGSDAARLAANPDSSNEKKDSDTRQFVEPGNYGYVMFFSSHAHAYVLAWQV